MIHRTPTESGAGVHGDKVGGERLGAHACGVPGLPAPPRPESRGRPPLPRGASFLHRGERSLARSAGALWSLEQRVETLRLSKGGVFEAFFDALASMSSTAHLLQMFDSTVV